MPARKAGCSFCCKSYRDTGPLVEGPGNVYICGECVELCQSIIVQEKRRRQRAEDTSSRLPTPEVLQAGLHELFAGQDEATQTLAVAAWNHYARVNQGSPIRILLIGPTRSSKLFLARALARSLGVPFAHGTAANLVPLGSSEHLAESVFYKLLASADFDAEAAQRGVIYLDGLDHPGEAQELLLRLMEGGASSLFPPGMALDVTLLLFICGGAFLGFDQVMACRGRHPEQPIISEDLIAYGLPPDLARHFQVIVKVSPLNEETLVRLATSGGQGSGWTHGCR